MDFVVADSVKTIAARIARAPHGMRCENRHENARPADCPLDLVREGDARLKELLVLEDFVVGCQIGGQPIRQALRIAAAVAFRKTAGFSRFLLSEGTSPCSIGGFTGKKLSVFP